MVDVSELDQLNKDKVYIIGGLVDHQLRKVTSSVFIKLPYCYYLRGCVRSSI